MKRAVLILLLLQFMNLALAEAPDISDFCVDLASCVQSSVQFVKDKRYPVYCAPSDSSERSGEGKAIVSTNGKIDVYGSENGWLLIQYQIGQEHARFGYIKDAKLSDGQVEPLHFKPIPAWITCETILTDDPLHSGTSINQMSDCQKKDK